MTEQTKSPTLAELRANATPEERAFIDLTIASMRDRLAKAEAWTDCCWLVGFGYGVFHKEGQRNLVPPYEATQYNTWSEAVRVSARLHNGAGAPSEVIWSERAREDYVAGLRKALEAWTGGHCG